MGRRPACWSDAAVWLSCRSSSYFKLISRPPALPCSQGQAAECAGCQRGADHGQCRDPEHQADPGPAGVGRATMRASMWVWSWRFGGSHAGPGMHRTGLLGPSQTICGSPFPRTLLQHGKVYSDVKSLRYGHLMIMTDQASTLRSWCCAVDPAGVKRIPLLKHGPLHVLCPHRPACPCPPSSPASGSRWLAHQGPADELLPPLLPLAAQAARLPGGVHHAHHQGAGWVASDCCLVLGRRSWPQAAHRMHAQGNLLPAWPNSVALCLSLPYLLPQPVPTPPLPQPAPTPPLPQPSLPPSLSPGHQGQGVHRLLHPAGVRGVEGSHQPARLDHQVLQSAFMGGARVEREDELCCRAGMAGQRACSLAG